MITPLSSPDHRARQAAGQRWPGPAAHGLTSAATTLASAATAPTERSIPPVMITKVMPSAISANIEL